MVRSHILCDLSASQWKTMKKEPLGWKAGEGVKFSEKQGKSTETLTGVQGPAAEGEV